MRKTRVRKQKNKRHTRKKNAHKRHVYRRTGHYLKGGVSDMPMVGSLDGEVHKGLGKIVVAGPMGVMIGKAYVQTMSDLDQQGPE
jgi:hypothetical protein